MSRTYRRKDINCKGTNNSVDYEVKKAVGYWKAWELRAIARGYTLAPFTAEDYHRKEEREFHTDKKQYRHRSVPSWFCNLKYHRRSRMRARCDIRRNLVTENWDDEFIGWKAEVFRDLKRDWW